MTDPTGGVRWLRPLGTVLLAVALAGCGSGAALDQARPPREGRAGMQVSGEFMGAQLALSDGSPRLVVGDCDPGDGPDDDVCAIANDINGELFVVVIENPDVLTEGATLPVADTGCGDDCDDVADVVVVDVQQGVGTRRRAVDGSVRVTGLTPLLRYAGAADLRLSDGRLQVDFDLVPRDD